VATDKNVCRPKNEFTQRAARLPVKYSFGSCDIPVAALPHPQSLSTIDKEGSLDPSVTKFTNNAGKQWIKSLYSPIGYDKIAF
jgi:hypothetical protein